MVIIRPLNPSRDQQHLAAVTALWRANSAVLGFFPAGAFDDYADKGQILIALDQGEQCVGYLLYRTSRDVAIIVHLCVSPKHRESGIAKMLVDALRNETNQLRGIRLSCRRDFSVSRLWPKLGFVALSDRPGRSVDGMPLTTWWCDYGHPNLFTHHQNALRSGKLVVVIDANIFFDLGPRDDAESNESKALTADWVQDNIELYLTPEILNEIDRQANHHLRDQERIRSRKFEWVQGAPAKHTELVQEIIKLYQSARSLQDESDVRQLAHAIAGDAKFFITRDGDLLELADRLYELFGINVVRPADLIVHLDSLESETDYLPVSLAGTEFSHRLVAVGELDQLTDTFAQGAAGERSNDLRRKLTHYLTRPDTYSSHVVFGNGGDALALYVHSNGTDVATHVPILRIKDFSLGKTLARYLGNTIHLRFACTATTVTKIDDSFLPSFVKSALSESGYILSNEKWFRIGLPLIGTSEQIGKMLLDISATLGPDAAMLETIGIQLRQGEVSRNRLEGAELERVLWPAKLIDVPITNYIVPIQAAWAKDLFDEQLALQDLFGAKVDLALQQEAVYYRKNYFSNLRAPGRILWYVSEDRGFAGSGHIRACSRLDEVLVGKPKELFRRFRRLGVYEWKNVYETAERDINSNIMAFRFSHTEPFNAPVSWREMQQLLKRNGITSSIQSPTAIDTETFTELYRAGKGDAKSIQNS